AENEIFVDQFKQVLFVGFNALNRAEAKLFREWQEQGKALFYFDADSHYLDDKLQEAGLFIRRNIFQTGLLKALGDVLNVIGKRADDVHVYESLGKISETKLLYDLLSENQDQSKSSAILLADESMLVPLLQSLPYTDVNITTGYPLIQSPIYGLLDLWMNVQVLISQQHKEKIPYQLLETYLTNPMSKVSKKQKQQIQTESADKQLFEVEVKEIDISQSVLPRFFRKLQSAEQTIPTLSAMIDSLLLSLADNDRIRQIESNLLMETKKVLNQLQLGFSNLGKLSIGFQIGLIRKALGPISSAIEGNPLKALQLMGLSESRCLNFDQVYIL